VLWSVIVIADLGGIDLESAFTRTMDGLEHQLARFADPS
jgi:NTP pyrophosphatase (non-canonical NTP hydrolase)